MSPRDANKTHRWVDFDSLILVTGRHSNDTLYKAADLQGGAGEVGGKTAVKAVYIIGDAEAPRLHRGCDLQPVTVLLGEIPEEKNAQQPKAYKREVAVWGVSHMPGGNPELEYQT